MCDLLNIPASTACCFHSDSKFSVKPASPICSSLYGGVIHNPISIQDMEQSIMMRKDSLFPHLSIALFTPALLATAAASQVTTGPILRIDEDIHEAYMGSATQAQNAEPFAAQRGVGLDGSLRSQAPFGWLVNANPFAHKWNLNARYNEDIMLHTGRYSPTEIDLNLPAPGFRWTVGRTYTIPEDGGAFEGYMGYNWQQFSQPEVVYHSVLGDDDVIYLVYGADRFLEFRELEDGSDVFRGVNGASGAIVLETITGTDSSQQSVDHDMFVYWDRAGTRSYFFDADDADNNPSGHNADGQLWKIIDAAGNTAYVGDETNPTVAITSGYDASARMQVVYDTAGRKYDYTYSVVNSKTVLTSVEAFVDPGSGWVSAGAKVEYEYATTTESGEFSIGDLKIVLVTMPLSGYDPLTDSPTVTKETNYRYYTNTGSQHWIRGKHNPESLRRFRILSGDSSTDSLYDFSASSAEVRNWSEVNFTYYSSGVDDGKIRHSRWPGQQGDDGLYQYWKGSVEFEYEEYLTYSDTQDSYDSEHASYVRVLHGEGGSEPFNFLQYFDESGQPLSYCIQPHAVLYPDQWSFVTRDASIATTGDDDEPVIPEAVAGTINAIARPMAIDLTQSNENPGQVGNDYIAPCVVKPASNLVYIYPKITSSSDPYYGFETSQSWQYGRAPVAANDDGPHIIKAFEYLDGNNTVTLASVYEMHAPFMDKLTRYSDLNLSGTGQSASEVMSYTFTFHAESLTGSSTASADDPLWLVPREVVTNHPAVPTSMHGSGVSETETEFFRADGTMAFYRDAVGTFYYYQHQRDLLVREINDVDLSQTSDIATADAPSNFWTTVPGTTGAMHLIRDQERDEIGRVDEITLPTGRVQTFFHTALKYDELVTIGTSKTTGNTHKGPGTYVAYDHAGNMIVDAIFEIEPGSTTAPGETTTAIDTWVDTTATTTFESLTSNFVFSSFRESVYEETGLVVYADRVYFEAPTSGIGTRFYNYDEKLYGYGHGWRVEAEYDRTGTMREFEYDGYSTVESIRLGSYLPNWYPDSQPAPPPSGPGLTLSSISPLSNVSDQSPGVAPKPVNCCTLLESFYGVEFTQGCDEQYTPSSGSPLLLGTAQQGVSYHQADAQERSVFDFNPDAPHEFREYDNLGRLVAVGRYSAVPSELGNFTQPDPVDRHLADIFDSFDSRIEGPSNITTNRVGLVEYLYNPRGQLYKAITHEIDQSNGSKVGSVETIMAYDAVGRQIYSNDGIKTKTTYDAIGRVRDVYVIGYSDDMLTNYADLTDPDDDVVLLESHYARNNESGNVILRVDVSREPEIHLQPQILGMLDQNDYSDYTSISISSSNLYGRPQITEYQYDDLDRPIERHVHGTGNIETATFNLSSPPSGALVTQLDHNTAGRVSSITDPLGRVQTRQYDLAGRATQVIDNYVSGGTATDENRKTEYGFQNTKLHLYRAFTDSTNYQETKYTYGEFIGTALNTSRRRDRVSLITYPDLDTESFEYDIHNNLLNFVDRAGNEFEISYDVSYRPMLIDYVTVASGFESSAADEILIEYEDRGMVSALTQSTGVNTNDVVSYNYDGWGLLRSYTQSHDSLSTAATPKTINYLWEASQTSGPSSIRMTSQTNPDGSILAMNYAGSTNGLISRVLSMTLDRDGSGTTYNPVTVASYKYLGLNAVSRTEYPENDVYSDLQNSSNVYDALDRFNRVTRSRWNRERASNEVPFFDTTVHWDDGSNVLGTTDHIFDSQFNFVYMNDDLDRMTQSHRGNGSGTSITIIEEQEDWVLSKIGNWSNHDLDLNGDLDYIDTDEFQAESTFSSINEQTQIDLDLDDDGLYDDDTITRTYDDAGNLTANPDKGHVYKWDSLGRLVAIYASNGTDQIAEFKYNALGYRIAERLDSTGDGFITSADDVWTRLVYDARWRVIETYNVDISANTEDQVERHVHHAAGLYGAGTGSYIDSVVLRDRDTDADGAVDDERHYFCQNWRHDVVAIVNDQGYQLEQIRYSPYGVPFAIPFIDQDQDGDVDSADGTLFSARYGGAYDVRADADLDGDMDFADVSFYSAQGSAIDTTNIGRAVQSSYGHNLGYSGNWRIDQISLSSARYRWYDASTGSWMSKDPAGYIDGPSLFAYVASKPIRHNDPMGLDLNNFFGPLHETFVRVVKQLRDNRWTTGDDVRYTFPHDQDGVPGIKVETSDDVIEDIEENGHRKKRRLSTHGSPNSPTIPGVVINPEHLERIRRKRDNPSSMNDGERATEEFLKALEDNTDTIVIEACRSGQDLQDILNEMYPDAEWECFMGYCVIRTLGDGTSGDYPTPWYNAK